MNKSGWLTLAAVVGLVLLSGFFFNRAWMWGPGSGWGSGMMGSGMMGSSMMRGGMMGGMMQGGMMGGSGGAEQLPPVQAGSDAPRVQAALTLSEWAIAPADLQVEGGRRLVLTVRNEGVLPHNLAIPRLGVRLVGIAPGASRTVELDVPASGSYDLLCDIPGHAQAGQRGKLTVLN